MLTVQQNTLQLHGYICKWNQHIWTQDRGEVHVGGAHLHFSSSGCFWIRPRAYRQHTDDWKGKAKPTQTPNHPKNTLDEVLLIPSYHREHCASAWYLGCSAAAAAEKKAPQRIIRRPQNITVCSLPSVEDITCHFSSAVPLSSPKASHILAVTFLTCCPLAGGIVTGTLNTPTHTHLQILLFSFSIHTTSKIYWINIQQHHFNNIWPFSLINFNLKKKIISGFAVLLKEM